MKQSIFFVLFLAFTLATTPSWSCRPLISDERARSAAGDAYFIGIVKGDYLQQYPDGVLKEVGIWPIVSYKADSSIDLTKPIIIKEEKPKWTSCDANPPVRGQLMEVYIIKTEQGLKLRRFSFLQTVNRDELINELRSQAKYVTD